MKIKDILSKSKHTVSFEFFPPKTKEAEDDLFVSISKLQSLKPSFVSITYGAMGSTQTKTFELSSKIKKEFNIETMAHLTSVGFAPDKMKIILAELKHSSIDNVLALRGDPPAGVDFCFEKSEYRYAYNLVDYIKKSGLDFSIGVAGYPEGHIECRDKIKNIEHLKMKVDRGADFIISQFFFVNEKFFEFVNFARKLGVKVPIIAGIMPVTNPKQLEIFENKCGAFIPDVIREAFKKYGDDSNSIRDFGVEYSTRQCGELIKNGFSNLHFYTLNRSTSTVEICKNLKLNS